MRDKTVSRYCNYCAKEGRACVYIDQDGSPMWRLVCEQCRAETTGLLKEGECVETPYDQKAAIDKIKMKDNAVIVFPNSDADITTKAEVLMIIKCLKAMTKQGEPDSEDEINLGVLHDRLKTCAERNGWI